MSFCEKCGSPNPDQAKFCTRCGTPLSAPANFRSSGPVPTSSKKNNTGNIPSGPPFSQQASPSFDYGFGYNADTETARSSVKKGSKKLILILILIIAALIAVILFLLFRSGLLNIETQSAASYEQPVQQMFSALEENNSLLLTDSLPEEIIDQQMTYYDSEQELADDLEAYLFSDFEQYDNIHISYEITDRDLLDSNELEKLMGEYSDTFNVQLTIDKAYNLGFNATITADSTNFYEDYDLTVIQIGENWYLDLFSL